MKLGILGAGGIASTMAKTVAGMKGVEAYAVAARDLERAREFAQKYEVKKAYGSYEEMLADDEVELVYIATPHSHHYLHAKMCLEAGKHVLCEKAFTVNAEQAQDNKMKLGILGAGGIASTMAKTVAGMKGVEAYAVAARDLERAREFAQKYEVKKAYGSYEEMLADDEVGLVYIATPHSHHYLHAKMCLEAGKHVLCEKAFTVNAEQAQKLFDLAKEKKLLITEAIWTRYMPSRKMINDIIESGVIGEVTAVTANLSYTVSHVERIRKPELAGGALLDVGVYPINFASMVLGDKVKDVKATAIFQNGVDILDSIAMVFEGDRMATLQCGAREISDRMGSIFGTRGYMQVQNINNPEKITVFDTEHKEVASYVVPEQISGYEYEVESCMKAIHEGKTECPEMPHAETIRIMKIMDDIRKSWNYEIPCIE